MAQSIVDTTREQKFDAKEIPVSDLVSVNQLEYNMLQPVSAVVARKLIEYASNVEYKANGNIVIRINSGDAFANYAGSWLTFRVDTFTGATSTASWGEGSVCNIFKELQISHSSGTTILTQRELSSYIRSIWFNRYNHHWRDTVGTAMGSGASGASIYAGRQYAIPLYLLGGLFNTHQLSPPYLNSGLKITLKLNSAKNAVLGDAPITNYTVKDFKLHLDTFEMMDSVQSFINSESSKGNVAFNFKTYKYNSDESGSTNVNISMEHALSQVTGARAVHRLSANIEDDTADSYALNGGVTNFRFRLGSLYFPERDIDPTNDPVHGYMWSLMQDGVAGKMMHSSVSFSDYATAGARGVVPVNLERHNTLNVSGLFVSGSRQLVYNAATTGSQRVDLFVEHYTVLRLFLYDKIVVLE